MWVGKRFFDLILSSLGLILLSPLFIIIAILIKLNSKGEIFFFQTRVGMNERLFSICKFRTMIPLAESQGLQITSNNDPRINALGKILRKFKIDELPQLINVFKGEMSLVGPRPEVPKYIEFYPETTRKKIFSVKPGITDWASIKYKDENQLINASTNPEQTYIKEILPNKLNYSLEYINKANLFEDLNVILQTLLAIIK